MKNKLNKYKICAITFLLLMIFVSSASALSCSYTYSVKGSMLTITPSISADANYYRYSIGNGTNIVSQTQWIPSEDLTPQKFGFEFASLYTVTLIVKNHATQNTNFYAESINIHKSSPLETVTVEDDDEKTVEEKFNNVFKDIGPAFMKWWNERTNNELFLLMIFFIGSVFIINKKIPRKKYYYEAKKVKS